MPEINQIPPERSAIIKYESANVLEISIVQISQEISFKTLEIKNIEDQVAKIDQKKSSQISDNRKNKAESEKINMQLIKLRKELGVLEGKLEIKKQLLAMGDNLNKKIETGDYFNSN